MAWLIRRRCQTLYCILILVLFVLKDCQSLFLRHSQSGKCITTGGLVYNKPSIALPYWAVRTNNCLDPKAQFRYLENGLVQNIKTGGNLYSAQSSTFRNRLAVFKAVSQTALLFQNSDNNHLTQTSDGSLSFWHMCLEPNGTYIDKETYCNKPKQKFTFGSVTDYNHKMKDVRCSPTQRIEVQSADYGNFRKKGKFNPRPAIDKRCSSITNCQLKARCNGNRSCELKLENNLLLPHYCSDTSKEIYTKYTCVDESSSVTSTGEGIRLSPFANRGYIEIQDGLIWRRISEKSWSKRHQKMLCKHLGFDKTDTNHLSTISGGVGVNIATGDVICYTSTQPSETSCCIHLTRSTTTSNVKLPYVKCVPFTFETDCSSEFSNVSHALYHPCNEFANEKQIIFVLGKVCDKPLLNNYGTFPDSVFSGKGGSMDYEKARLYENGWCPTGSGAKYLMIDLQKEYHITQVVTMGDKDQTKWSQSYSLKYSHVKSLVDKSRAIQIKGNQNGYQASITILDIYNVRYIKIESTGYQNFCLRIELCGQEKLNDDDDDDDETRENISSKDKMRLDLMVPLVLVSLCLLLSLGMNLYLHTNQLRCLKTHKKNQQDEQNQQMGSSLAHADSCETPEHAEVGPESSDALHVDHVTYAIPGEAFELNRIETRPVNSTEQTPPSYMPLQEYRETGNVYQSLQPPGKRA